MKKIKESKREFILNGNLFKVLLLLSLPVVLNNVILSLYQIIDSFFSEAMGPNGLSAVSFTTPIIGMLNAVSSALSVATTALVARMIGKNLIANARKTVAQVAAIACALSFLISGLGYLFSYQIMQMLQASTDYIGLADLYFKYTLIALPFKFIGDIYFSYKGARGETFFTMIVSLSSMIVKIICSIIFVHILKWGVLGLGIATLVSYLIIFFVAVFDMFIRKGIFKINLTDFKFNKELLVPFFIMIIPLLIEKTSLNFSHVVVNVFITRFDSSVIAAYGLTNKINTLFFTIPTAIGTSLITIVGQNLTVGNHKRNVKAIKLSLMMAILFSVMLLVGLYSFQVPIIKLFTKDELIISHTIDAMNIYSHTVIAWAFMQIAIGVFYASGYASIPIIISFARLFIFRIPLLYVLLEFTSLGAHSIWYCMLIANVLAAMLAFGLMVKIKWYNTPKYLL